LPGRARPPSRGPSLDAELDGLTRSVRAPRFFKAALAFASDPGGFLGLFESFTRLFMLGFTSSDVYARLAFWQRFLD
jgi:hypothetical protein